MGRAACCWKVGLHSGPWTSREDSMLSSYILSNGEGNWRSLPSKAGLLRCGKSCRLRWMNYLRPDIKRGNIGPEEDDLIIRLHRLVGNRWSLIAGRLPGRTDNEIKNYWNSHLCKKLKEQGLVVPAAPAARRRKQSKSSQRDKKQNSRYIKAFDKLYAPKPIRLTARIATDYSGEEEKLGSSSGHEVEYVSAKEWSDAGEFELTGDAHGLVDSDYQCYLDHPGPLDDQASPVQHDPMMLERLYDEYSQLLNSGVDV